MTAYLNAAAVRQRYGGVSDVTLWRWIHDQRLNFPKPLVLNRRRYFDVQALDEFDVRQAGAAAETVAA